MSYTVLMYAVFVLNQIIQLCIFSEKWHIDFLFSYWRNSNSYKKIMKKVKKYFLNKFTAVKEKQEFFLGVV